MFVVFWLYLRKQIGGIENENHYTGMWNTFSFLDIKILFMAVFKMFTNAENENVRAKRKTEKF